MAGEIDACKIVPAHPEAYDAGRQIGQQAAADGNVGKAWRALSEYTQSLFAHLPQMPAAEKQKLWAEEQRDVIAGMSCADPKHFKYVRDDATGPKGDKTGQRADVGSQVDGILNMFDRFNRNPRADHSAEPSAGLENTIMRANAQIHNKIEPLGPEAMRTFAHDFNERRGQFLDIPDVALRAELVDHDTRLIIRREVP